MTFSEFLSTFLTNLRNYFIAPINESEVALLAIMILCTYTLFGVVGLARAVDSIIHKNDIVDILRHIINAIMGIGGIFYAFLIDKRVLSVFIIAAIWSITLVLYMETVGIIEKFREKKV